MYGYVQPDCVLDCILLWLFCYETDATHANDRIPVFDVCSNFFCSKIVEMMIDLALYYGCGFLLGGLLREAWQMCLPSLLLLPFFIGVYPFFFWLPLIYGYFNQVPLDEIFDKSIFYHYGLFLVCIGMRKLTPIKKGMILVTGGLGYIGSHVVLELCEQNYKVVIGDNLSNSSMEIYEIMVKTYNLLVFELCDFTDQQATHALFSKYHFTSVIHCAALKSVPESVAQPNRYLTHNLQSTFHILSAMLKTGCENMIFSSSCSVYGDVNNSPITEKTPFLEAKSPYALSKQLCEYAIQSFPVKSICLRYFNPVGNDKRFPMKCEGLVPIVVSHDDVEIFGDDYATCDGTAVRDYVHIKDIARAHTLFVDGIEKSDIINLGSGSPSSVKQVVDAVMKVSGQVKHVTYTARRPGDVGCIYADNTHAKSYGWEPLYSLEEMIQTLV